MSATRPADFRRGFLSAPSTNSSKTGAKRTTSLPSFSLSPSQPRSAVLVAGNHHETGRFGQFLMKFHGARSDTSGHQIERGRFQQTFGSLFRPIPASFWAPRAAGAFGGVWAVGWGPQLVCDFRVQQGILVIYDPRLPGVSFKQVSTRISKWKLVCEMDKSWMHVDRKLKAYELGVEGFLNFAVENLGNTTHIRCPCVKCGNIRLFGVGIIRDHSYFNGIHQSYKIWTWHGEPWEWTTNASRNVEEDEQSRFNFVSEEVGMDDNDLGDIGFDPYEFANVIGDGDQPLYPGSKLLILQGDLLPEGNTLYLPLCMRKDYEDSTNCPTCDVSRWKEGKDSILKEAKSLTWHAARQSVDDQMSHPADSPSWKLVDDKWLEFGKEPRNLRLALSSDGFNPHSSLSSRYSCWPVILVTYNLPPWLCMKRKFMILTLLIFGPKQPGNDIDVYLEPLIDDLKSLWDGIRGVACPICGDDTPSHRLKNGHKICYIGHRKWLSINHPYQRQRAAFNGKPLYGMPPEPLNEEEVLHMVEDINYIRGSKNGGSVGENDGDRVCWKKKSKFFDLEYWKYLHVRHVLDVMHIEKNVCDSIIGTLLKIPGKNKDGIAARLDLLNMVVKTDLQPEYGQRRTRLLPGPWNFSRAEKSAICNSFYGMKKLARYAITRLCFFFNSICAKTVDVSKLDKLEEDVVVTLCLLEKYFPPSLFDIMVHLVVHLVREVRLCGPVYFIWMYPFERYMKVLKGYVQNRNRPEGCIAEQYIAEEAVEFCTEHLSDVSTVGVPSSQKMGVSKPLSSCIVSLVDRENTENTEEVLPYIEKHMIHIKTTYPEFRKRTKWLQDKHNSTFIQWLHFKVQSELNGEEHNSVS
ncbi:unnamed protein product [Prunus armeniaca]